jgi:hypothetical protein
MKGAFFLLLALLLAGCATIPTARDPLFRKGDVVTEVLNPYHKGVVTYGYYDPIAGCHRYYVRFIPASDAQGWARAALVWENSFDLLPSS